MFKKGRLVRSRTGFYFTVEGQRPSGAWVLRLLVDGQEYWVPRAAPTLFTLIGNNYKAKE